MQRSAGRQLSQVCSPQRLCLSNSSSPACYSGSFIQTLANNRTIVLTAAAKNRASFGCSDQRHLTYFGEAFFRDALPNATSLLDAFETAKRAIAQRERNEKISASEPQAFIGEAIAARGREFEAAP